MYLHVDTEQRGIQVCIHICMYNYCMRKKLRKHKNQWPETAHFLHYVWVRWVKWFRIISKPILFLLSEKYLVIMYNTCFQWHHSTNYGQSSTHLWSLKMSTRKFWLIDGNILKSCFSFSLVAQSFSNIKGSLF